MSSKKNNFEYKLNQEINLLFKEPEMAGYAVKTNRNITFSDFFEDKMMVISAIRAGIPYTMFNVIQDNAPFTEDNWADFLDVSTKSLQRYKTSDAFHFKAIHSEKILEMAEVTNVGLDVFGSMDKLKLWLNTPSYALGNLKPIELIKDSYGKELVITELTRINYGIFV